MGRGLGGLSASLRVLCKDAAGVGAGAACGGCTGIRTHLWLGRAVGRNGASRGSGAPWSGPDQQPSAFFFFF